MTAVQVRAAKPPAGSTRPVRLGDGEGLYLQIAPSGSKSWLFRYMLAGRSREMGLGSAGEGPGDVSLAAARQAAAEARALAREGVDPIDHRKAAQEAAGAAAATAQANTFEMVAEAYIKAHRAGWRNEKHASQWTNTLTTYAYPRLGRMPVSSIATADVLAVLEPIWAEKTETATRVRTRIEAVLDYATARELRAPGLNPATWRGNLQKLLPRPSKVTKIRHHPALPYQQVGAFFAALEERTASTAARALAFVILTACRSGEVLGATWREIELAAGDWTIPAERMKNEREHRVPLSPAVLAVLEEMKPLADSLDSYVFPSARKGKPLSNMALEMLLRRMNPEPNEEGQGYRWCDRRGQAITVHGFRSTFRDWTSEATSFPHEMAEAALSHVIKNKSEAAYRRGDMFEKRRKMMEAWAAFCARRAGDAKVLPLRRVG
nr:site-specific integrase [Roseomonas marmotae]